MGLRESDRSNTPVYTRIHPYTPLYTLIPRRDSPRLKAKGCLGVVGHALRAALPAIPADPCIAALSWGLVEGGGRARGRRGGAAHKQSAWSLK